MHFVINSTGKIIYFFLVLLAVFASCTSIYLPNAQNIPTFIGAKEFQCNVQAQVFLPPFANSFQVQGAYSISNHIGVIANYAYSQTATKGVGSLGEFGIGYYNNASRTKSHFSAFLGTGLSSSEDVTNNFGFFLVGGQNSVARENATWVRSNYSNWFIQPAYAFILSDQLNLIFSMKSSLINFENTYYGKDFVLVEHHGPSYHFEPSVTLKINFAKSRFSLIEQGGLHLTNDNDTKTFTNFIRLSAGIQWRISSSVKKE